MARITQRTKRGIVASLSTIALAVVGLIGMPAAAFAADPEPVPDTATLTLHKSGGTTTTASTGAEVKDWNSDGKHPAVSGAKYTLYKAKDINLADNAQWAVAAPIVTEFNQTHAFGEDFTVGTAQFEEVGTIAVDGGVGVKSDLPLGLYVVVETAAGTVDGSGDAAGRVQPFILTLPLQGDGATPVNFSPHIYMKSTTPGETAEGKPSITKAGAVNEDGTITWTISAAIPKGAATEKVERFEITDQLVNLKLVGDPAVTVNDMLNNTADASGAFAFSNVKDLLTWTATPDFSVIKSHAGGQVKIVITTSIVNKQLAPTNEAKLAYKTDNVNFTDDGEDGDGGSGTSGGVLPTTGKLSFITVTATDTAATANMLRGAVFTAKTGACDAEGAKDIVTGAAIQTGADGEASFNVPFSGPGARYCVTSKTAPPGYTNVAAPVTVRINNADEGGSASFAYTKIANTIPQLPITGANGRVLLMGGGAAAMLLAGGIYLSSRKREREDA